MTRPSMLAAAPALLKSDVWGVVRDPALISVIAMALAPMAVFHVYAAEIDRFFEGATGLSDFTRLASAFVTTLPGLLIGWIFAMRFLEDRDSNLEPALLATPVGLVRFALLRLSVAALSAAPVSAATALVFGAPAAAASVIGVCGGLQAVLTASLLPVLAANRVEGLAYSKFLSPFALLALIALIPSELRLLALPLPSFHMGELLLQDSGLATLLAAVAINLGWTAGGFLLFKRRSLRRAG